MFIGIKNSHKVNEPIIGMNTSKTFLFPIVFK